MIGNAAYEHTKPLVNTLNDVNDIAKELKATGFQVTTLKNADLNHLIDAVDSFVAKLHQSGGVGLLYYSGHGVQVNGHNYLVPVDARLKRKSRVKYEAFSLDDALSRMGGRGAGAINLVILDACRDNPFVAAKGAGDKGLARVDAPESTLILYATKPGATASDNPGGRNGLFTKHLRKAIKQPGVNVEVSFSEVVKGVYRESNREQYPWKEGVLLSQFNFLPAHSPPRTGQAAPVTSTVDPLQLELAHWSAAVKCGSAACLQDYLNRYPQGQFSGIARARLAPTLAFTVKPTPADARVRILNIVPAYRVGMKLKPGSYKIEVSKVGYQRHVAMYELKSGNQVYTVELLPNQVQASAPRVDVITEQEIRARRENKAEAERQAQQEIQTRQVRQRLRLKEPLQYQDIKNYFIRPTTKTGQEPAAFRVSFDLHNRAELPVHYEVSISGGYYDGVR